MLQLILPYGQLRYKICSQKGNVKVCGSLEKEWVVYRSNVFLLAKSSLGTFLCLLLSMLNLGMVSRVEDLLPALGYYGFSLILIAFFGISAKNLIEAARLEIGTNDEGIRLMSWKGELTLLWGDLCKVEVHRTRNRINGKISLNELTVFTADQKYHLSLMFLKTLDRQNLMQEILRYSKKHLIPIS